MAADDFFSRWAKKKVSVDTSGQSVSVPPTGATAPGPSSASGQAQQVPEPLPPVSQDPPTIEDVERLTPESDYSAFMAKGVDENVRRSAMKKLFADPHFNIMDGLDIYIDDYSKPDPLPPGMLAMLEHAKSLLDPLKHLENPAMRMVSNADSPTVTGPDADAPEEAAAAQAASEDAAADATTAAGADVNTTDPEKEGADTEAAQRDEFDSTEQHQAPTDTPTQADAMHPAAEEQPKQS